MMNNGAVLFLGILLSLAGSFWALVLAPQLQIGRAQLRQLETGEFYPSPRPGLAQRGAEVYRSLGCAECHTRQVRQTGAVFDLYVTDVGTNLIAVVTVFSENEEGEGTGDDGLDARTLRRLPALVGSNVTARVAAKSLAQFAGVGAKAAPVLIPLGPDMQRGWGQRHSVAQDYLHDYPVQLGNLRLGPDLTNFGERQTNAAVIHARLYEATRTTPGSRMPPYRFLYEKKAVASGQPLPAGGIEISPATANGPAEVIVPGEDAVALAAYLTSLNASALLFEAPRAKPAATPAATNTPVAAATPVKPRP